MDAIALTQALVRLDSINPPGREQACAALVADRLERAGFQVDCHELDSGRCNIVATIGHARGPQLGFTGHLDTVPLGAGEWQFDPLGAELREGRLYGRGSSDMKSGIAAFIAAAERNADLLRHHNGVAIVLTVGEETGCEGARCLVDNGQLPKSLGALIVGEPTANAPVLGHKGAFWVQARAHGVAAHGSMPDKGDNAILKLAHAACELSQHPLPGTHPFFGTATLNIGTFSGGININSVPDLANMTLDIRSVPGMDHQDILAGLQERAGHDITFEVLLDLAGLHTPESHPWVQRLVRIVRREGGEDPPAQAASYFTDASLLTPALGAIPTVILGPGEPAMAHQTDEYCLIDRLRQATDIYDALIRDWMQT
ncbi:MAG: M20 family metallopeptidase [Pigmentiphaga sp.]